MKKVLMFGAAALMFNTAAYANGGTFQDADGSSTTLSWSSSSAGDDFEDAGSPISAAFTLHGDVTKTCSMQAVDNSSPGLSGNIDLGTIGIHAGDELSVSNLFTMVGAAHATVNSAAAGCNYNNTVKVEKDDIRGLVNSSPGNYDSAQFQANIPYSATASFTGVVTGTGTGSC